MARAIPPAPPVPKPRPQPEPRPAPKPQTLSRRIITDFASI